MAQFTAKMQKAFAHFAEHRNKSEAYRYAYDCENMLGETIRVRAWELFEHPLMAAAVSAMKATAAVKVNIDAAWVLKRAALLADFNINAFVVINSETGDAYYDFSNATDDDWYCISAYTADQIWKGKGKNAYAVDRVKLKGHDKIAALKLVGEHIDVQAFKAQIEHSGAMAFTQLNAEEFKQARREMLAHDDC